MKPPTPEQQLEEFALEHAQRVNGLPGRDDGRPRPKRRPHEDFDRWTLPWAILCAAEGIVGKFSIEQLAVACWHLFPDVFCLRGYPEYPDPTPVRNCLFGAKGLIRGGYLMKVSAGLFALTNPAEAG